MRIPANFRHRRRFPLQPEADPCLQQAGASGGQSAGMARASLALALSRAGLMKNRPGMKQKTYNDWSPLILTFSRGEKGVLNLTPMYPVMFEFIRSRCCMCLKSEHPTSILKRYQPLTALDFFPLSRSAEGRIRQRCLADGTQEGQGEGAKADIRLWRKNRGNGAEVNSFFPFSLLSPASFSLNQHGEVRGPMKPSSSPNACIGDPRNCDCPPQPEADPPLAENTGGDDREILVKI